MRVTPNLPYWQLCEAMPTGCLLLTPELQIAAANTAYLSHHGLEKKSIEGRSFLDIIDVDEVEEHLLLNSFDHVLRNHQPHELESIQYAVKGATRSTQQKCMHVKNALLQTPGNKQSFIVHFETVVAPEKNAEQQCNTRETDFEMLVNGIQDYAIFHLNPAGIITSWNKGAEKIKGYTAEETIGSSVGIFYLPEDIEAGVPQKNLALALQHGVFEIEGRRRRKDGTIFFAHIIFNALFDETGKHYGFAKVTRDITAERQNKERINFLANITRNIEEPIITTDRNLNITRWNGAAARLFGWTEQEAIGNNTLSVLKSQFTPYERIAILESFEKNGHWHGDVVYLNKSGDTMDALCTISQLKDGDDTIVGNLILIKDITKRKKAEQELAKLNRELEARVEERTKEVINTEKKYHQLFDSNPMPIWVMSQEDFRIMAVNEMAILQYGYSREEFLSMTALDIRPEEEHELFLGFDHSSVTTEGNYNKGIWRHKKKDGRVIFVQVMAHDIIFENTPAKMVLANDVTDRVHAEQKLVASEKQYRTTLDKMLEGTQIIDYDWKYVYMNDALVKTSRLTCEELMGQKITDKYPGIADTEVFKVMQRVMNERVAQQLENEFVYPDGAVAYFQLSIQPVPEGIFVLSIDITDTKLAAKEIARSEEQMRTIMERISDAFIVLDTDWNYTYVNRAGGIMLQRDPDDLKGKNIWEEFSEARGSRFEEAFTKAMETQEHIKLEEYYEPLNLWVLNNIYPSPQGLVLFFTDITAQKQAQLQLMESEANLKAIFDNSSEGFILTDKNAIVKAANSKAIDKMLQMVSFDVRVGETVFNSVQQGREAFFMDVFNRVMKGETIQHDRKYVNKKGEATWIDFVFNPVIKNNETEGICITGRDVTEKMNAAERLQTAFSENLALSERLSAIINTLPANIALVNKDGYIIEMNNAWRRAERSAKGGANLTIGEHYKNVIRGSHLHSGKEGTAMIEGIDTVLMGARRDFLHEYSLTTNDGEAWYRMIVVGLEERDAGAVIMHMDISEVKRLEAQRMQLQLEQQQQITKAILQGQEEERNHIGRELHDNINQILAGIKLYLSVAGAKAEVVRESIQYPMQLLDQSIEEIRHLCSKMVTPLEDVQLQDLVKDLLDKLALHQLEVSFEYCVPAGRLSDELKLNIYRIIQELTQNMVKYARASRVTVSILLRDKLYINVADNGVGFDMNTKKNGIGLANIKSRVRSFDGRVEMESAVGEGTRTKIVIPI